MIMYIKKKTFMIFLFERKTNGKAYVNILIYHFWIILTFHLVIIIIKKDFINIKQKRKS